jgi:ABC-2 type transport system permease protein
VIARTEVLRRSRYNPRYGSPIKGPSALGSSPRRLLHLTWTIAAAEFKLAFFGSVLGYLWQLMRPLLLFGVIYLVLSGKLSHKVHLSLSGPHYAPALLLGIVMFTFFSEATGGAVTCLVDRENLIRKVELPRLAVPLATVTTALLNLILNLVPVVIFLLAEGVTPSIRWLELPLLIAALAGFSLGLAMLLSVAYVWFRDVKPIWEVVLQATFYASGIFFAVTSFGNRSVLGVNINFSHLLLFNPFATVIQQARHAMISAAYPSAMTALGGPLLAVPLGIIAILLVVGYLVFDRQAPYVAEQL